MSTLDFDLKPILEGESIDLIAFFCDLPATIHRSYQVAH